MPTAAAEDLTFVQSRLADYVAYDDEDARHASDARVRAYLGVALAAARDRIDGAMPAVAREALERTILRCAFGNQTFVRHLDHADLPAGAVAALIASDRRLVQYAERAREVASSGVPSLVDDVDREFVERLTLAAG